MSPINHYAKWQVLTNEQFCIYLFTIGQVLTNEQLAFIIYPFYQYAKWQVLTNEQLAPTFLPLLMCQVASPKQWTT